VRAFAAAWYGTAPGEVTGDSQEVLAIGREIGLTISPSVHEWSRFASDLRQAGIFGRAIRDNYTLDWVPRYNALRLLTLSEGDVEWVVVREHLADEDPPVECLHLDDRGGRVRGTWRHTPTTSQFVLQQLIAYLDHPGGAFVVDMTPSPELLDQLRSIGHTSIELGGETLIEGEDLLILVGESPFTQPDGWSSVRVEIGPSRVDAVPKVLSDLTHGHGGWFTGIFAENMDT
jgi:hypothetical protein